MMRRQHGRSSRQRWFGLIAKIRYSQVLVVILATICLTDTLTSQYEKYPNDPYVGTTSWEYAGRSATVPKCNSGHNGKWLEQSRELGGPVPLGPLPVLLTHIDSGFLLSKAPDEYREAVKQGYLLTSANQFMFRSSANPLQTFWKRSPETAGHGTVTLLPFLASNNRKFLAGLIRSQSLTRNAGSPYLNLWAVQPFIGPLIKKGIVAHEEIYRTILSWERRKTRLGLHVISTSLGHDFLAYGKLKAVGPFASSTKVHELFSRITKIVANLRDLGVLVVAASGEPNKDQLILPASIPGVLSASGGFWKTENGRVQPKGL